MATIANLATNQDATLGISDGKGGLRNFNERDE